MQSKEKKNKKRKKKKTKLLKIFGTTSLAKLFCKETSQSEAGEDKKESDGQVCSEGRWQPLGFQLLLIFA